MRGRLEPRRAGRGSKPNGTLSATLGFLSSVRSVRSALRLDVELEVHGNTR
jgi:hypothetical protein